MNWFYSHLTVLVEMADQVFVSKTSTSTAADEDYIYIPVIKCISSSFFLLYKCGHCYINHFMASINDLFIKQQW